MKFMETMSFFFVAVLVAIVAQMKLERYFYELGFMSNLAMFQSTSYFASYFALRIRRNPALSDQRSTLRQHQSHKSWAQTIIGLLIIAFQFC